MKEEKQKRLDGRKENIEVEEGEVIKKMKEKSKRGRRRAEDEEGKE